MKLYKKEDVPASTREILIKRKCDLCGMESKSSDWDGGTYEVKEPAIICPEFAEKGYVVVFSKFWIKAPIDIFAGDVEFTRA